MSLRQFHGFKDSVRWRVTPKGVEIEGTGIERTKGNPNTVTKVWETYCDEINRTARDQGVPCALILATICTESSGNPNAVRIEPGYVSDDKTPGKVSPGLMQTLISTARETMRMSFGRDWLLEPANSIRAGTAYIRQQFSQTNFDPPLVAAAYNAGRLRYQNGPKNRWKTVQYPVGTSEHVDRFIKFFNDAVAVLATHSTQPTVDLSSILGGNDIESGASLPPPARSPSPASITPAGEKFARSKIKIEFGANANNLVVSDYSLKVLEDILLAANLTYAQISSTCRSPHDQARVMYQNIKKTGSAAQKKLYNGKPGVKVIEVYEKLAALDKTQDEIIKGMERKINELGPPKVSRHAADFHVLNVVDVAPSSIKDKRGFEQAVNNDRRVSFFLTPPKDPGYHLEIPQTAQSSGATKSEKTEAA